MRLNPYLTRDFLTKVAGKSKGKLNSFLTSLKIWEAAML
jgi:hypothetical protein